MVNYGFYANDGYRNTSSNPFIAMVYNTLIIFRNDDCFYNWDSYIYAIAPSFSILLVGRFIQAVGTGLLVPLMFNVFLLVYPPERRGMVLGIVGLVCLLQLSVLHSQD